MAGMLSHSRRRYLPAVLLGAVLTLALIARLVQIAGGDFDGLYGNDAFAYYNYAVGPLRETVLSFRPPPPFVWPPGYPYLIAVTSLAAGVDPLSGQLVSMFAALLAPLFTALFVWEVWGRSRGNRWAPVLAGSLVALNGQLWQSSVVVMSDSTGLAAVTLGIWALARYGRGPASQGTYAGIGWLLLAAGAIAYAVLSRWALALVAIPATGYALMLLWRRRAWLHGLLAAVVVTLILAPILVSLLSYLLEPTGTGPAYTIDLQVVSWNPVSALRRSFETADGLQRYRLPNGLYYLSAPAHRFYFTPLLALFLLPGVWLTWKQRTAAILWLIWGWAAIVFVFLAGAPYQSFRFTLAYLPPLAALAAIGAVEVLKLARRWRPLLVAVVIVGLLAMAWGGWTLTNSFIERKNDDLARIEWVEGLVDEGARLITFNQTLTFQTYSKLETFELYFQTPKSLEALLESGEPLFLLIDTNGVESQWRGLAPSENYRWLAAGPGLEELGQYGDYTLFRTTGGAADGG